MVENMSLMGGIGFGFDERVWVTGLIEVECVRLKIEGSASDEGVVMISHARARTINRSGGGGGVHQIRP